MRELLPQPRKWCAAGAGRPASARTQNDTTEVQVHRCRTATSQNRDAENRGCSTIVAPAHRLARNEYDSALVWNSGRWTRYRSAGVRPWCAALTLAPHRQLACVHTTAFGRAVVPDVYWIDAARPGCGGFRDR